jgi:hypothetical protein
MPKPLLRLGDICLMIERIGGGSRAQGMRADQKPQLPRIAPHQHTNKYFSLPAGFYGLKTIFLLLAFLSLARIKSIEALRYHPPGEWGKLLGVDRAPEVRTIRAELKHLADQEHAFSWSAELCEDWMAEAPEDATVLYIDGHVRVYRGTTKTLPEHCVARQRLCLSATADYWVNAMDGQPFFVVSQAVDPGLLQVMEHQLALRKATKRHATYDELPNEARFDRLSSQSKHFIDTIKMVAYRAETAMAQILTQKMTRHDDARSRLRAIYNTEVDVNPDLQANTLTIRLHPLANNSSDQAVRRSAEERLQTVSVWVLYENRAMLDLARRAGFTARGRLGLNVELAIALARRGAH